MKTLDKNTMQKISGAEAMSGEVVIVSKASSVIAQNGYTYYTDRMIDPQGNIIMHDFTSNMPGISDTGEEIMIYIKHNLSTNQTIYNQYSFINSFISDEPAW